MPRRKAAVKRDALPDPLFGSEQVSKFINVVMREGKKSIAEKIVYSSLTMLAERLKKDAKSDESGDGKAGDGKAGSAGSAKGGKGGKAAHTKEEILECLNRALGNVSPAVEVKSRRVGGATYQVPIEVAADRGIALAMRWVVQAAKGRAEKTMALRLAAELYEACLGRGAAVKTRDDVHRMARANQAFAHYRW